MAATVVQVNKVNSKKCLTSHVVFEIKRKRPSVLVATPGRLIDLCENYGLNISDCRFQILDEGDKMLDMGFDKDIETLQ